MKKESQMLPKIHMSNVQYIVLRNLNIYSKSKNVHVKIVSKSHTYISLCCMANPCSLQFEFFQESALPHDCESHDGF